MSPRSAAALALCAAACTADLPPEQPCDEVGYAIAARYEQCTGDAVAATVIYDAYVEQITCQVQDFPLKNENGGASEVAYECALVTRNLACELAIEYGDDLAAWLATSPVCDALLDGP